MSTCPVLSPVCTLCLCPHHHLPCPLPDSEQGCLSWARRLVLPARSMSSPPGRAPLNSLDTRASRDAQHIIKNHPDRCTAKLCFFVLPYHPQQTERNRRYAQHEAQNLRLSKGVQTQNTCIKDAMVRRSGAGEAKLRGWRSAPWLPLGGPGIDPQGP